MRRLEPIIHEHVLKLMKRFHEHGLRNEIIEPHHMLKACASDVITLYAFGDSFHWLDKPDCGRSYFEAGDMFNSLTHVFGAFPWLFRLAVAAPR